MQPVSQAVLLSWSVPPAASFALALTALIYLRGWFRLRRAGVPFVPPWRAVSFLLGLLSLWIALASPFDTFAGFVLTAHMLQHMTLMMVAPPLILLGAPLIPLVRGLPIFAAREFAGPFLNWRIAIRVGNKLTQPLVALLLMGTVMFAWHTPRLYELALASSACHEVEHACFFLASLIFWWPVVQPWPSRPQWPRWTMVPYLLIGDLQNTALSAILVFSDRVLYPTYTTVPRLFDFSSHQDQAAAGAIMWVVGSIAFVIPAILIAVQCLEGRPRHVGAALPRTSSADWLAAFSRRSSLGSGFLRRRFSAKGVEAVSFLLLFAAAGLGWAWLASGSSGDDDQAIRLRAQSGAFAVTVLAPAGDLEAGSSDFSVLVQDRNSNEVLRDAVVDFHASGAGADHAVTVRANADDSENKLLQSAAVELPTEGYWTLGVNVRHGPDIAQFKLPLRVVKADTGVAIPWPYIVWLALSLVLLLAWVRRHVRPRTIHAAPYSTEAATRGAADLS